MKKFCGGDVGTKIARKNKATHLNCRITVVLLHKGGHVDGCVLCLSYVVPRTRIIDDFLFVCLLGWATQFIPDCADLALSSFDL
jgi:hypothetical protein